MVEFSSTQLWVASIIILIAFITMFVIIILLTRKPTQKSYSQPGPQQPIISPVDEILADLEKPKVKSVKMKTNKKVKVEPEPEPTYHAEVIDSEYQAPGKEFNILKNRKKNVKWLEKWFIWKRRRQDLVVVSMDLPNGDKTIDYAVINADDTIIYGKGKYKKKYKLDIDKRYYIQNLGIYGYDFSEEISIPYRSKLTILNAKAHAKSSPETLQIENLLNPRTLHEYSESHFAQSLIAGGKLADEFRQIKLFLYLTCGAAVITLLYLLVKTGAFESVQGLV